MCGITGIFTFNEVGRFNLPNLSRATQALEHRGPDNQGLYVDEFVGLGHRRLSIIDLSTDANQPFQSADERYQLIFNGEIYNYRLLRKNLEANGVSFRTESDTEVLLQTLIHKGAEGINDLNGFFAFAFYDKQKQEMLVARDRYGIKPLYFLQDEDRFLFASELKSLLTYGLEKELDAKALYSYLQLNYIPAPFSIIEGIHKLEPGHFLSIRKKEVLKEAYYELPNEDKNPFKGTYEQAQETLKQLLDQAVERRMVADVPLGTFLSGGIDSSIISTIAAKKVEKLHTFSIGYTDNPFFDETQYAEKVAKQIGSEHQVFKLSTHDLYSHLHSLLDHFSEPFADSSALAVYVLSKETRQRVTVALSGDGADELFGGYNKHAALSRLLNPGIKERMVNTLHPLWKSLPKSRNSKIGNLARQLDRFAEASKLDFDEQYWHLASLQTEENASQLLADKLLEQLDFAAFSQWKNQLLSPLQKPGLNNALWLDQQFVLAGDMLPKVDLMSMAHALEVRVPFLDHELVAFANSLPDSFKVGNGLKKRVLQDAYRNELPAALYNRPKHGFEVPLLDWLRKELKPEIENTWLNDDFIVEQDVFQLEGIQQLKKKLFSGDPGDSHAHVWALISFQQWWKNFMI